MMLLEQIHKDMIAAKRGSDPIAKTFLNTLYAEAASVGKNKRNAMSTDDEVIAIVKKFVENANENSMHLKARGQSNELQVKEIKLASKYLPTQLTRKELENHIRDAITELDITDVKDMGRIMGHLKTKFSGSYDGKIASEIVKSLLK